MFPGISAVGSRSDPTPLEVALALSDMASSEQTKEGVGQKISQVIRRGIDVVIGHECYNCTKSTIEKIDGQSFCSTACHSEFQSKWQAFVQSKWLERTPAWTTVPPRERQFDRCREVDFESLMAHNGLNGPRVPCIYYVD